MRWWEWWPALPGVLGIGLCLMSYRLGLHEWYAKQSQEVAAIMLSSTALLAAAGKLALVRHRFYVLLSLLAFFVVFREIHLEGTGEVIYVAVAALSIWAWIWRASLIPFIDDHRAMRTWLVSTAIVYVLSQFVARRGFQHLLPEGSSAWMLFEELYDDIEEVVENIGHVMLLVTALCGPWRPWRPSHRSPEPVA